MFIQYTFSCTYIICTTVRDIPWHVFSTRASRSRSLKVVLVLVLVVVVVVVIFCKKRRNRSSKVLVDGTFCTLYRIRTSKCLNFTNSRAWASV